MRLEPENDMSPAERRALGRWLEQTAAEVEPDALSMAAWLDGEVDEAPAARVEAWLARQPALLEGLRNAAAAVPEAVPEVEIRRAQALVSDHVRDAHAPNGWGLRLVGGSLALAAGAGGLAVGLGLAQAQALAEGVQAMTWFADFAALAGAW
jgi:hypothetical protein